VDRRSATLPSIETASIAVTRHRPASSNDRKRIHKSNVDLARKNLRASRTISDPEDERLEIILRPRGATTGCSDTIDDDDETPHEDLTVSWDEIHKFSVMVDLNIVPSDDEDDEDYTESTGDTKVTEPKYGPFYRRSQYRHSSRATHRRQNRNPHISDFPLPTVKAMVQKFNRDYLMRPNWRTE
jgi:hypothetical protein